MDQTLQNISELCRDPMLSISQGKIAVMNAAARKLFPALEPGDPAEGVLPEHILQYPADTFLSSAVFHDVSCTVSALRSGDTLTLSLVPEPTENNCALISDSLLSGMLSALFNIQLAAEQLRARLAPGDTEGETQLSMLFHNYYTLHHRLSNLSLMRQFGSGSAQFVPYYVDLADLCQALTASIDHLAGPGLAPIEFDSALDSLPACLDAPKVERLLVNLLSNALKHTPADGHIRLGLLKSGGSAVISVDDTGDGIPPEVLNGVFRSYEKQLDEQTLSAAGTGGLGLALCRAIAELHGGALILESREGVGTSVRLMLPLQHRDPQLHSNDVIYENGGMVFLLTELSDVLDWQVYTPEYLE